jgi:ATP synthase proteolipid subunit
MQCLCAIYLHVLCRVMYCAVGDGYTLYQGYAHLGSGLACGLAGLAAGMAIGIVGDSGVRCDDHVTGCC